MVERLEVEADQAAIHGRAGCQQARDAPDRLPQQPTVKEAVEDPRGQMEGKFLSATTPTRLTRIPSQNKDVSFTYGCLDPVMVTQMAKYLDTVYVSGWQCSSTASSTDEPGPDLADYPMVSWP